MTPKRPKVEPIRNPTLFEMDKLEQAAKLANSLNVERPYSEPGLLPWKDSRKKGLAKDMDAPPSNYSNGLRPL